MKALSDKKEEILFRRARITELRSKGLRTDSEIAKELGCSRQTVNSDIRVLRRQAETEIKTFQTKLPYEFDTMIAGVRLLLKKNWEILDDEHSTERAIANASHIILSCYEKLSEQLHDKYEITSILSMGEKLKPSLEEQAMREAYERNRLERGRVF